MGEDTTSPREKRKSFIDRLLSPRRSSKVVSVNSLSSNTNTPQLLPTSSGVTIETLLDRANEIKDHLSQLKQYIIVLHDLYNNSLQQLDEKLLKGEIKSTVNNIETMATTIRRELKTMSKMNREEREQERIVGNCYRFLTSDFVQLMQQYQELQEDHRVRVKHRIKSELLIAEPDLTGGEMEVAIQIQLMRKRDANNAYQYISDKYDEILEIEQQVKEVEELFHDMALILSEQSERLDRISYNTQTAKTNILVGRDNIRESKS